MPRACVQPPSRKEIFPTAHSEPAMVQLCAILYSLSSVTKEKSLALPSLHPVLRKLLRGTQLPLSLLFCKVDKLMGMLEFN